MSTAVRAIPVLIAVAIALFFQTPILRSADVAVTSDADAGAGSLREAIGLATSGDVIVFDIPLPAPVITLNAPLPQLSGDTSFRNDGAASVVIDRNGTSAWQFSGGTIDPTGLNFVDGGVPSTDADIITTSDTTLIGSATLTGNLTSLGAISPGVTAGFGSFGTFEVTGDVDASNSTLVTDIDSAQSDLLRVGGTATLTDAVLNPNFTGNSFSAGQSFTVVEAGGIVGTFANAGDIYDLPNQPFLEAVQDAALPANQFGFLIQDNGASFQSVASGCNQSSAAAILDELQALGTAAVMALRNESSESVALAIDQLSGSIYPSLIGAEINHIQSNVASVRDRIALQQIADQSTEGVFWARGYGISGKASRDACRTVGYLQEIGGLELGTGLRGANGLAVYTFAHLADSQIRTREVHQRADVESYRIGGLVEYQHGSSYAVVAGGAGTQEYEVRRWLDAFQGSEFAESSFDGTSQFGYVELGHLVYYDECIANSPYLGMQVSRVDLDSVVETGDADFAISTAGGDGESFRSVLGLSLRQIGRTPLGPATTWFRAGWMHEFGNESETFTSQLATATVNQLLDQGVETGRDWGFIRLQLDMAVFLGGQFTVSYLGQYNSRSSINTGLAGVHWTF